MTARRPSRRLPLPLPQPPRRRHRLPSRGAGRLAIAALLLALRPVPAAADTFSIAAVDVTTGEIGSAGASCVGPINQIGAFILSDIIPGVGVIHTQASYLAGNQRNARARMLEGLPPAEIVTWLAANDVQGRPGPRQYGIVDLRRGGESAAYTGDQCQDYKNHITGPGYSIQGNILSGQKVLDDMEQGFTQADEDLAGRLMAALEAAKVVGADTRCAARGTSSQSAFIKVIRPQDGAATYLELVVPDSQPNVDPIDLLRAAFDAWRAAPTVTPGPTLTPSAPVTASATATPDVGGTRTATPDGTGTDTPVSTPADTATATPAVLASATATATSHLIPTAPPSPTPGPLYLPWLGFKSGTAAATNRPSGLPQLGRWRNAPPAILAWLHKPGATH